MRIEQSALSEAVRPIVLDVNRFSSGMPSEREIQNAALNPLSSGELLRDQGNPQMASTLQRNAVALAQSAHYFAVERGLSAIPAMGSGLDSIVELVGQQAFSGDIDIKALALGTLNSVIDTIVEGPLSSVPFVGAAARTVWGIVQLVYNKNQYPHAPRRPLFRMDPSNDDQVTRAAIARVRGAHRSDDWTPIFLPNQRGQWRMNMAEGGIDFQREAYDELYDEDIGRLGCAPGDLFYVDAGAQSRVESRHVKIPEARRGRPRHESVLKHNRNPEALHSLVFGLSEFYPSLAAFARSVWSLVGTRDSTALFQIDASALISEWDEFADASAHFRNQMDRFLRVRMEPNNKKATIAAYLGNVGAAMHTLRKRDDDGKLRELSQEQLVAMALDPAKRAGTDSVGRQAVAHGRRLEQRQRQAARTQMNALVSKNAPGLRTNPAMRNFFLRERKALLNAGKLDGVPLADVPDAGLRKALIARGQPEATSGIEASFVDPVWVAKREEFARGIKDASSKIRKPLPLGGLGAVPDSEDTDGDESRGYGLAIAGAVALAGLTAGGVAWARRRA